MTDTASAEAICSAVTDAVTRVAFTKVVGRGVYTVLPETKDSQYTVAPGTKFAPFTVSVKPGVPDRAEDGSKPEIVAAVCPNAAWAITPSDNTINPRPVKLRLNLCMVQHQTRQSLGFSDEFLEKSGV